MTVLVRPYAVRISGAPAPKGSLKCVGKNGRHQLIEANTATKPWRARVKTAGLHLRMRAGGTIVGPIGIEVTVTVPRAPTVDPASRPWPCMRSKGSGDVDKLARTVLDGLQDAKLFADDAQVVELIARKVHPDTPDAPEAMPRPGAVIRVYPIT